MPSTTNAVVHLGRHFNRQRLDISIVPTQSQPSKYAQLITVEGIYDHEVRLIDEHNLESMSCSDDDSFIAGFDLMDIELDGPGLTKEFRIVQAADEQYWGGIHFRVCLHSFVQGPKSCGECGDSVDVHDLFGTHWIVRNAGWRHVGEYYYLMHQTKSEFFSRYDGISELFEEDPPIVED
jgi:hypothetical protein